jgi:hypothetical protein
MISRDPKCVFVASDAAQAAVVANWLEHQSIPARVMDTMTLGGLDGLTAWTGVSARGIEVWVLRPDDAERARALVEEHNALQSDLEAQDPASRPVLAFCEECGNTTEFPGQQRDTIQPCPQCGADIDVSDWEHADEEAGAGRAQSGPQFELRSLRKPLVLLVLGCIGLYFCLLLIGAVYSALSGR